MKRLLCVGLLGMLLPLCGIDTSKKQNYLPDSNTLIEKIEDLLLDSDDFLTHFSWIDTCNLNKSTTGWTPLSKALAKRFSLIAEQLMMHGASLSEAIKRAIEHDTPDALLPLLNQVQVEGKNINFLILDNNGTTPLGYAIQKESQKCITLLQQNPFNATTFDTLRVALLSTNNDIVHALLQRDYQTTAEEIAGQLLCALTDKNIELLSQIYQTIDSTLLKNLVAQLREQYKNLFDEWELATNFATAVAINAALSLDNPKDLTEVFSASEISQETLQNTLKNALVRNACKCIKYLLQHKNVLVSLSDIIPLVHQHNQNAVCLYLYQYCDQKTANNALFDELVLLKNHATNNNIKLIKATCCRLLETYYLFSFIKQDDLASLQNMITEFTKKQIVINHINLYEQALICNAKKSAQWLYEQIKETPYLTSFIEVLQDDNTALVQEHLQAFLKTLNFATLSEEVFHQLIFDLEYALPDAIKALSTTAAKSSWENFYTQTIKPLINQFIVEN